MLRFRLRWAATRQVGAAGGWVLDELCFVGLWRKSGAKATVLQTLREVESRVTGGECLVSGALVAVLKRAGSGDRRAEFAANRAWAIRMHAPQL